MAIKTKAGLILALLLPLLAQQAQALTCTESDGAISFDLNDTNADGQRYQCQIDGQTMRFQLYKLGICTAEPAPGDFATGFSGSKCIMMYDSPTGQLAVVTRGSSSNLSGINVSNLKEATYTHAVVMIGNAVESQYSVSFPSSMTILGHSNSGNHCWTRNTSSYTKNIGNRNQLSVECGSTPGAPGFARKAFDYWPVGAPGVSGGGNTREHDNGNKSYLMKSPTEQADPATDTASNLIGVVTFDSPKILTANTRAIDLGFQLSELGQAEFSTRSSACETDGQPCLNALRPWGFDFCVEFDAKCSR